MPALTNSIILVTVACTTRSRSWPTKVWSWTPTTPKQPPMMSSSAAAGTIGGMGRRRRKPRGRSLRAAQWKHTYCRPRRSIHGSRLALPQRGHRASGMAETRCAGPRNGTPMPV